MRIFVFSSYVKFDTHSDILQFLFITKFSDKFVAVTEILVAKFHQKKWNLEYSLELTGQNQDGTAKQKISRRASFLIKRLERTGI